MYLFKESPTRFIFGRTKESTCRSGKFGIDPSEDLTKVTIYFTSNGVKFKEEALVTSFQKADESHYANYAELKDAVDGFFSEETLQLTSAQLIAALIAGTAKIQVVDANGAAIVPLKLADLTGGTGKIQGVDAAAIDDITRYKTAKLTVTLLHSPVAYAPGDVVLGTSLTALKWENVAKANNYGINVVGARIQTTDPTGMASKTYRLHIFNTSIDPIADNAAFSISDANTDKREGSFLVQMGATTMSKVGLNYTENIFMQPVSKDVYLILETIEGFTPSAADLVINIYLKYIQGN